MPRVAAVDCGTNSIRLLITDLTLDAGRWRQVDVDRRMTVVRLGAGVDATGRLDDAALDRTFAALDDYAQVITATGVERVRFVATSATRDAANAEDFLAGVQHRLGIAPEVIGGAEEAALSFVGATTALAAGHPEPFGVVDIGGGSTEIVVGGAANPAGVPEIAGSLSVDIGCVRLAERHLRADPPTAEQLAAARADVDVALDAVAAVVPLSEIRTLVGVAGTVTTLAAAALDLPEYDSDAIHASVHPVAAMMDVCRRVTVSSRATRSTWPYLHPGRVDVIGAGALVWGAVIERVVAASGISTVVVSERDILDGIAASLVTSVTAD